ncbi:hypothetical protein [Nonomuraea fuscirosea]|uniref:hypothetical protein n=1 Tax=Nonomuraea fuscirosea TaxID=1291556 RepID=UPI0011B1F074|nr:hypothetical protein [Nonomuraea fuscirosea]
MRHAIWRKNEPSWHVCGPIGGTCDRAGQATLTLPQLDAAIGRFFHQVYNQRPHSETKTAPQARWEAGAFIPRMPGSLEQLDLLLLTVPKPRKIHTDGIHFLSLRYCRPHRTAARRLPHASAANWHGLAQPATDDTVAAAQPGDPCPEPPPGRSTICPSSPRRSSTPPGRTSSSARCEITPATSGDPRPTIMS